MSGFSKVTRLKVPRRCMMEAYAHLRDVGRRGEEGMALWVGTLEGSSFHVTQTVIPKQVALRVGEGICVTVGGAELHRINIWLHENGLRLIAQLHSHPDEAYHSDTDDTYAIATTTGCLSLVVPLFAVRPFSLDECAVYRLDGQGRWLELTVREVAALIQIED